jgi:hypothetical protein
MSRIYIGIFLTPKNMIFNFFKHESIDAHEPKVVATCLGPYPDPLSAMAARLGASTEPICETR